MNLLGIAGACSTESAEDRAFDRGIGAARLQLLRRVFGEDVTRCPQCGDRLRVLAFLSHPDR